ncbi:phage tail sheath protein [Ameyamaea chiangmaiensis NBRC 103196]|uniref:Phage tail protein n=1 Tax=Ameyamaea chiangmaiensis TaxID=442969 RepID=A0A850P9E8_9PROT|nr:phage tail protein [Ameyamaea chiangmaiensis]MBS4075820.1 phage tail protein [Ameyamaea chiangmaiensis]NVN39309.1 phage tail protein [Ameyamaea chiangmaiensis]GBQ63871.1 phage tail sheath protein [Ameyamaea chiangmaiensis NBRC 103196]
MARVYQSGSLNTTSLVVPNLYVQVVQPQTLSLNGASSSRIGIVGTAGWGPVNSPVAVGSMANCLSQFGTKQSNAFDIGTAVNIAIVQGANDFRVVRVTDGSDVHATATVDGVTLTARYSGSAGNGISITIMSAQNGGYTLSVVHAVLGGGLYSGSTWEALRDAVAADAGALIAVTLPQTVPALGVGAVSLTGGSDGDVPSSEAFIGSAAGSGTGLYALQAQSCALAFIHGLTDSATWTTQAAFGLQNGVYMLCTGPSGDTITNATARKATAGLDSYAVKLLHGDWLWWLDDTNGMMLVSPQAFVGGCLASLTPAQSSLNKQIYGILGSQKAGLSSGSVTIAYSDAELGALIDAGIDVVCNPAPGGVYWSARSGHNSSTTSVMWGDNYTRLTNFLADSFSAGLGAYVGRLINQSLFFDIRSSILGLLSSLLGQGILGSVDGSLPYAVVCDSSNNTLARTALGYVQCDIQVQYQGINEKFIVNLQGGTSVQIATASGSV